MSFSGVNFGRVNLVIPILDKFVSLTKIFLMLKNSIGKMNQLSAIFDKVGNTDAYNSKTAFFF